jgi:hypothetical protein
LGTFLLVDIFTQKLNKCLWYFLILWGCLFDLQHNRLYKAKPEIFRMELNGTAKPHIPAYLVKAGKPALTWKGTGIPWLCAATVIPSVRYKIQYSLSQLRSYFYTVLGAIISS